MVEPGSAAVVEAVVVGGHDGDSVQRAPAERAKAAEHEQREEQAFPV